MISGLAKGLDRDGRARDGAAMTGKYSTQKDRVLPDQVDVLIIGGGMVGLTLAVALGQGGLRVVIVDREDPAVVAAAAFDGRASALATSSRRVLDGLGLWPMIEADAAPILDIRVSDGASPLFLHYDHRQVGTAPFGHIVENRTFRRALQAHLPAIDGVVLRAPASVATLKRGVGRVEAELDDGSSITAALAIACDGRASRTRAEAGIGVTEWSYEQVGIVCTIAHERPHNGIAQERFLPAGPFAILPMVDGAGPVAGEEGLSPHRSSIVWTERRDVAARIMADDDASFLAELTTRFGDFLGQLSLVGPRWSYPLALSHAETYLAQRLVLAGDAAHGMHPIAGQGLNMGLRDAAALAEVLVDAHRLGLDIGAATVLERYQRWRRFDNVLMLGVTDSLNRLFSNDLGPLRLARDLGLAAVNRLPPLKRLFMRHAMGLVGELPRLARGERL